jgi:hypothetical protein
VGAKESVLLDLGWNVEKVEAREIVPVEIVLLERVPLELT